MRIGAGATTGAAATNGAATGIPGLATATAMAARKTICKGRFYYFTLINEQTEKITCKHKYY